MSDELSELLLKLIHNVVMLMPEEVYSDDMMEIGKIIDSSHLCVEKKLVMIQEIAAEKITGVNASSLFKNQSLMLDQHFYYALHRMDKRHIVDELERLKVELMKMI